MYKQYKLRLYLCTTTSMYLLISSISNYSTYINVYFDEENPHENLFSPLGSGKTKGREERASTEAAAAGAVE